MVQKHKSKRNKVTNEIKKIYDKKSKSSFKLKNERDIAMDFAQNLYKKFDKLIKSVILFGSSAKHTNVIGSDIDIIIILDDVSIKFDNKLILWYREELGKIIQTNAYKKDLHINTIKLTTWWYDLSRGDPTILNVIRYGDALIDFGGFFSPIKILLEEGKIKPTPEAIYSSLNRVPNHIRRSKLAEISAIEGCYWSYVDSAQSLLMSINVSPPSPEHITILLKEKFVEKGLLKMKYVSQFRDLYDLHRRIMHGEIKDLSGKQIDMWQDNSEDFFKVVMKLIKDLI
jgi:predicted nucleotidyltransferase/uncharacterized protein (UPF0332 family)